MIYHQPLAYLIGMEGLALLRAWAGDFDEGFVTARLAEVRALLDEKTLAHHPGVLVESGATGAAYRQWAATYDDPGNGLFDLDEPVLAEILNTLPAGLALDAACGTGRLASRLVQQGHRVIGVDNSVDMLDAARVRLPNTALLASPFVGARSSRHGWPPIPRPSSRSRRRCHDLSLAAGSSGRGRCSDWSPKRRGPLGTLPQ